MRLALFMNLWSKAAARRKACSLARSLGAFSLIEIMVAVSLLTVIILGLLLMFNQTQQAFQVGTTQTDVLEAGRATMELMRSDLAQMMPTKSDATNFYVANRDDSIAGRGLAMLPFLPPQTAGKVRTNVLQEFFFLTRANQDWSGIGYVVSNYAQVNADRVSDGPFSAIPTVGTLYRYETNAFTPGAISGPVEQFWATTIDVLRKEPNIRGQTNLHRVLDGVVHFRVVPCNLDGTPMLPTLPNSLSDPPNDVFYAIPDRAGDYPVILRSNAVPGYIDLELGILEPRVLAQYRAIPDSTARYQFLKRQAGRMHLFRQRIPIASVDPQAYP